MLLAMETSTAQFNKVFVIESLGPNDMHSGTHIVEVLKLVIEKDKGLGLAFWKVKDRREFFGAMQFVWQPRTGGCNSQIPE